MRIETEERHCPSCTCEQRAPVQADAHAGPGTIAWHEHMDAYAVYAVRYGRQQSAGRIAERGGFGFMELTHLLGHGPKTWEPR